LAIGCEDIGVDAIDAVDATDAIGAVDAVAVAKAVVPTGAAGAAATTGAGTTSFVAKVSSPAVGSKTIRSTHSFGLAGEANVCE
jgi:hypothetical protein